KSGAEFCEIRNPIVNIQLGGFANSNKPVARRETLEIGLKYCFFTILPLTAYILRKIFNR
ncbi:MAG TPA: hypothetical protein P5239_09995, partial [Victivallales bacterium]|nr:hypothetical protein [Victivallales bacterium]